MTQSRIWLIYALCEPSGEVRYIGVTTREFNRRLAEHKYRAVRGKTHRDRWLKSLLNRGENPRPMFLEQGVGDLWPEAERRWVSYYRQTGADLVNATDGGEGTIGYIPSDDVRRKRSETAKKVHTGCKRSPEARANMSKGQLVAHQKSLAAGLKRTRPPRSEETRRRMAEAQTGKKASLETRQRLSEAHKNPSAKTRLKLAEAVLRRSPEQRASFAKNQQGKPKSDGHKRKIAEAQRQAWQRRKGEVTPSQE